MAEDRTAEMRETKSTLAGGRATLPGLKDETPGADITVSPKRAAKRAYWAELVFGTALAIYIVMAVLANQYAYFAWDLRLALLIQSVMLPGFRALMSWVSMLGSGWLPVTLVVGTGAALLLAKFRIEALVCMLGVGSGSAINVLLKAATDRPRPDSSLVQVLTQYRNESFPSGHVVFFVEFFGFLFFLAYVLLRRGRLRRAALSILGIIIILVGVSRVYLGAHWPSDAVGAYLAGGVWLMLMIEIYRRLKSRQKIQP